MEAQIHQQCNGDASSALPTKFLTKVLEIPVVKFSVSRATGFYERVKVSQSFIRFFWFIKFKGVQHD
jgi:hypothetical protein